MKHVPGSDDLRESSEFGGVTWKTLPDTEEEVLERLKESPKLYRQYRGMNREWKTRFLEFCQGKKSLPLTYDPFFHYIFHPDRHTERLERLISGILGMKVKIKHILSREDSLLDSGNYLIMDLVVELENGSIVNVEIQKQGYAFSSERMACYAADLLTRQYMKMKSEKGHFATYGDIKKVYVIVLFEESPAILRSFEKDYLHYGTTHFNTGLPMDLLTDYCLIALDVFRKITYSKSEHSELHAWLSLLTTENLSDAEALIERYPWMEEIYREIAMLRYKPEEVLGMWSEALRILDENTMKYYAEQLKEERDAAVAELDSVVAERDKGIAVIAEKDNEIAALRAQLAQAARK